MQESVTLRCVNYYQRENHDSKTCKKTLTNCVFKLENRSLWGGALSIAFTLSIPDGDGSVSYNVGSWNSSSAGLSSFEQSEILTAGVLFFVCAIINTILII